MKQIMSFFLCIFLMSCNSDKTFYSEIPDINGCYNIEFEVADFWCHDGMTAKTSIPAEEWCIEQSGYNATMKRSENGVEDGNEFAGSVNISSGFELRVDYNEVIEDAHLYIQERVTGVYKNGFIMGKYHSTTNTTYEYRDGSLCEMDVSYLGDIKK